MVQEAEIIPLTHGVTISFARNSLCGLVTKFEAKELNHRGTQDPRYINCKQCREVILAYWKLEVEQSVT